MSETKPNYAEMLPAELLNAYDLTKNQLYRARHLHLTVKINTLGWHNNWPGRPLPDAYVSMNATALRDEKKAEAEFNEVVAEVMLRLGTVKHVEIKL